MRKSEKEIKDKSRIEEILNKADICRIGTSKDNKPYIVPMNFAYEDNALYLHSAKEGKKLDFIKANNDVCFETGTDYEIIKSKNPCNWSMKFLSVIGYGKAYLIEDLEEKKKALSIIMKKYSKESYDIPEKAFEKVAIIKVDIEKMTGKKSGI